MNLLSRCRRTLLFAAGLALSGAVFQAAAATDTLTAQLAELERNANGRLGVALIDTGSQREITYRGEERFAMASTFKVLAAGAVLQRSVTQPALLEKRIRYDRAALQSYAPVTGKHLAEGMTVAELCAAAIEWSDNTAANLLLTEIGGPQSITKLARSLGDDKTRLDRWEPELNTAIPGDERDTSTPRAMARNLQHLALGEALPQAQQQQLIGWLKNSQTGAKSIRAGVPAGWDVGDKTGSGDYGTTNDLAVIWPPHGKPLVLAIYFTQPKADAEARRDVLATATRLVLASFTTSH
ncbi:class A beta-lactamase (plasmid) [Chimaeribacter arupi]|uniref:Beta-lactamase n=1 Tax=Nissabacter archeti TaxID=1917880 RepID=A0ABS5JHS2_9GAMM|nr:MULTISPECIES: class A beta-lactamase [Yersiniaceae]MBS0969531.1 class A beta-lactamase [Nissabacter archeti]PLR53583.1 class A beta-lactamase [Chimaeribacter arupi]WKZ94796.1 class A beta-lactamase [Chimaeribacter arupi]